MVVHQEEEEDDPLNLSAKEFFTWYLHLFTQLQGCTKYFIFWDHNGGKIFSASNEIPCKKSPFLLITSDFFDGLSSLASPFYSVYYLFVIC